MHVPQIAACDGHEAVDELIGKSKAKKLPAAGVPAAVGDISSKSMKLPPLVLKTVDGFFTA